MESSILKTRIAVLWIFIAAVMSAHEILFIWEPSAIQKVISGEMVMTPAIFFVDTLFFLVPLVMAVLTLTLKDMTNRTINLVLGGVFTVVEISHLISCPIVHLFDKPLVHQLLIVGSMVVVAALIFWNAWRWPKLEKVLLINEKGGNE